MKYMTFNRSCSYAGLANFLEDYSINFEDFEHSLFVLLQYKV